MSSIDQITVNVTDATFALPVEELSTPLILATDKAIAYAEYASLADVVTALSNESIYGTAYATKSAYLIAQTIFAQSPRCGKVAIYGLASTDSSTVTTALTALVADEDTNGWYTLILADYLEALAVAIDAWVGTQLKLFATRADVTALPSGFDSDRSILFATGTANNYPDAAIIGLVGGYEAGSVGWANKPVSGATADGFTSSERAVLLAAKINYLIGVGDGVFVQVGKTAGGKIIESIRGRDWVKLTLINGLFALQATTQKLTFSDDSIDAIKATAYGVLTEAVGRNIILVENGIPQFSGSFPTVSQIAPGDKTAGIYRFSLTYTEAGEVISIVVNLKIE